MEKRISKLFKIIFAFIFVFILGIGNEKVNAETNNYVNYNNISMTSEEYETLVNLGFSEYEIYHMSEETFEENKDIEAELVAKDTKYYKVTYYDALTAATQTGVTTEITEEEYNSVANNDLISPLNTVTTSYKSMTTTISSNGSGFRYKVSLSWTTIPSTRSYDIIGIGFADNISVSSPIYFLSIYCNSSGSCTESSAYASRQSTWQGVGTSFKLPSSSIVSLGSTLYFDVAKENSSETITSLTMIGDYSHATSSVSSSASSDYTITDSGIFLGSSISSKYDSIPHATSVWAGTW